MKKYFVVCMVVLMAVFSFVGCNNYRETAEMKQTVQTNKILAEIDRQVGLPNITNFQQKKLMKMIYELNDKENLICYAYLKSEYSGKLIYIGKCVGYGVPFSAQYTNPMKIVDDPYGNYSSGGRIIPQADPNGLYMPTSSSATWLMMLDDKGKPHPVYLEPSIVVSPFKLKYNVVYPQDEDIK